MNMNIKRILAFGSAGILVVAALFLATRSNLPPGVDFKTKKEVPRVFSSSTSYDKDTLLFSNARSFTSYNYKTGQAALLSPDNYWGNTGNIDKPIIVTSDKKYIIFHTSMVSAGTALDDQLIQEGLDHNKGWWWIYNTAQQTFKHFDSSVASVRAGDNTVYTLSENYSQQSIIGYSLPDLKQTSSIPVTGATDFFVTDDGFLIQQKDGKVLSTKDGIINTPVLSLSTVMNVSRNKKTALATRTQNKVKQLVIYNLQTKSETTIGSNVANQIAWSPDNDVVFADQEKKHIFVYDSGTGGTNTAKLDKSLNKDLEAVAILSPDNIIVGKDSTDYLLSTGSLATINIPNDNYQTAVSVSGYTTPLVYFPDESAFILTLDTGAADMERDAIYSQLKKDGFNPDLLELRFAVFTEPIVQPQ